jgi:hypothetical protein
MKSKDDVLLEKTLKLAQVEHFCRKQLVKCPATADQACLRFMALEILQIIQHEEF